MDERESRSDQEEEEEEEEELSTESVWSTQIHLACETLVWSGNFDRLERFLWALPESSDIHEKEIIQVAKACVAFNNQEYEQLYDMIHNHDFSKKYHSMLQVMWRIAHYRQAEKQRGRTLCAVGKYRIRRKFPLPKTIWDGKSLSHCFSEESRNALNNVYKKTPYPTASEKLKLAKSANLSVIQVQNWFKNKRQRTREMENKHKRVLCKSSNFIEQEIYNNYEHDHSPQPAPPPPPPPALIPKQLIYKDAKSSTEYKQFTPRRNVIPPPSNTSLQTPIKPTFHKVKPMFLPMMQPTYKQHFRSPTMLCGSVRREKHYIRCIDWSARRFLISKPVFER